MSLRIFQFGEFRLDAATRALTRAGEPVALPPKVFDCIVYLLEHRARAVGRDELIAAVWGKVDVSDGVLGQTILVARRALDDTGREQQVIRTVLRFRYHWVAPVEAWAEAANADVRAAEQAPAEAADARRPAAVAPADPVPAASGARRWRLAATVAVLCMLAAVLAWTLPRPRPANPPRPDAATPQGAALVLPVAVIGDGDAAWIRLGVMDLVAARLRETGQPVVPSDNVVALARAYDRAAVDPAQLAALADAAAAGLVIDARAERLEGRWRVTLHTLLGPTPALAASGEADDVLGAARAASDRLAAALGLAPGLHDAPRSDERGTDSLVQQVEAALLEERVEAARQLLDGAPPALRGQPLLRFQRARVDFQSGHLDTAATALHAVATAVPPSEDAVLHARALNALGAIALQREQPAAAMPDLDRAIELLGREHAFAPLGKAYNNRAAGHAALRDYAAAQADLAQARIALATAGDVLGLALVDSNAGAAALDRDHFAEAAPILASAAERFAAFHAYAAEMNARNNLALVHLAQLDPATALAGEARLHELVDKVSDPERRRTATLVRVEVLRANGRLAAAEALLRELRADAVAHRDANALARAQAIGARQALADGDAALAEHEASASLNVPPQPQDPRETGLTWLTLVRAQRARGDTAAADASLAKAREWADDDASPTARLHLALATAERATDGPEPAARTAFEDALARAERDRAPIDLLCVSQAYVAWLMRMGDFHRASVVAEGVAGWAARDYDASLLQLRVFHALRNPSAWPAALARTRALAGEREVPAELGRAP